MNTPDASSTTPRGRKHRGRRFAAALGAVAIGVVGVGSATSTATAADRPNIRVAMVGEIDSLNPFIAILASSTALLAYQYEPLVQFAASDNAVAPGMADSWETSDDAKTWTFKLDPDAKWSDDEPITSEDVVWTIEAIKENDALKQAYGALLENIDTVSAPDDTTVVMELSAPQASNPGVELPIVPEHVWSTIDDPAAYPNDSDTVGSGPFIITKYSKTGGVELKANDNYREGAPKVGGVIYVPFKNSDASVQALKTGEVDIAADLTPAQYKALESVDNITAIAGTGRRYTAIAINPGAMDSAGQPMGDGNPVLQDPIVRQAIVRAIDSSTLLDKVMQGLGDPATAEIPPTYPLYHWNASELPYSFDPAAANKLLDDAGYTKGADGIRVDKSGNPIQLRLMGRSTDPTHQQMVDYIKPWLKDIGIGITSEMKAPAQVNDDSTLGNYDLYFTGWGMGPDPDFQMSINLCSSRPNADGTGATSESNWCSPEFDEMYAKQHAELDQEKRSEYVVEAQKLIYNAAVNNVLYYQKSLQAYRSDRFGDFVRQPEGEGVILGQNGPWGLYSATPIESTTSGGESGGGANPLWWIIGGVVVIGVVTVIVVSRRRGASADNKE
ncbi:ABC transporter substrate-binding protein [Lysinibacter cavernae]|uniref:Peptide/nickel transport system substrate-binding protein n=1 Tax=Lysinibacter cavernae TaxID=1640652 RepID=A0A7X5QYQ1_9MICO|nr:ABC transporter substrate-binding protein [Lysinibacter cavernae]NIH52232.1 peptide/nickel transport system substrate-binding protein [Lysinibacter cavernae]